jgi:patatin-like phospholipase domain-containing protein 2
MEHNEYVKYHMKRCVDNITNYLYSKKHKNISKDNIELFGKNNNKIIDTGSISFSGGGYNCVYHLGVVKYIFENNYLFKNTVFLGASGGAGIACFVLAFKDMENRFKILEEVIEEIKILELLDLHYSKQVENYINILTKHITLKIFDETIKDKESLIISLTQIKIPPFNILKTKFISYDNFINSLMASACIPFVLDNQIRKVNDEYYIDGGLTNNLPIINDKTIKISCLNYPFMVSDIYSKNVILRHSFYPPNNKYINNMIKDGYNDFDIYMKKTKSYHIQNKNDKLLDNLIIESLS